MSKTLKEQTTQQLLAKLVRTETTGSNILYAGGWNTTRFADVRLRWIDIAAELCSRSVTNANGMIPTEDGDGEGEYNFGDACS